MTFMRNNNILLCGPTYFEMERKAAQGSRRGIIQSMLSRQRSLEEEKIMVKACMCAARCDKQTVSCSDRINHPGPGDTWYRQPMKRDAAVT